LSSPSKGIDAPSLRLCDGALCWQSGDDSTFSGQCLPEYRTCCTIDGLKPDTH